MCVYESWRIFRASPESTTVVTPLTGSPLYIIIPVAPIPPHLAPTTLVARRRAFIIYYSRRTVRKRQVLVCCLYNQLAQYTRSYIILYTYLLVGYISIMCVEKEMESGRKRERDWVSENEEDRVRKRRAKRDYANVYCIYV